ncbi:MAG: hypothetical protein H7X80_09580 [bacterium]|nr:hypothetical protein [Candidatus Kapabacteria bacterium]
MKEAEHRDINELYRVILKLETLQECRSFFRDLLTEHEINELAERWKVARMLTGGASYVEIEKATGASSRTIARVARWVKEGKGGYLLMLDRLRDK